MNYRRMPDAELRVFMSATIERLESQEIECLDPAIAEALALKLSILEEAFEASIEASLEFTLNKQTANTSKLDERQAIIKELSKTKKMIEVSGGDNAELALGGFSARKPRTSIVANAPTGLSATSDWLAGNLLKFEGNNRYSTVMYEITRCSKGEPWIYVASTKKKKFLDQTCEPGKYYMYRVRAIAAKTVSGYSNEAVVNGR